MKWHLCVLKEGPIYTEPKITRLQQRELSTALAYVVPQKHCRYLAREASEKRAGTVAETVPGSPPPWYSCHCWSAQS